MLQKNIKFKSFLPPAITVINNVTYVIPGWHIVPDGTTLEEVYEHWEKENKIQSKESNEEFPLIEENVISKRTGETYEVKFNGFFWSCTCAGYGFRRKCKHIEEIKNKYKNV